MSLQEACSIKDKVIGMVRQSAMSDQLRRDYWRAKIGNKLKINPVLYNNLVERLSVEPLPKKSEKTIIDDLDRTFPNCNDIQEGKEMYANMKLTLSLFELYRPDIGYVQGMSYLLLVLYYYFDKYECFVYLANLIVCNRFVRDMYTFNMGRVTAYSKLFEQFLRE